jgi:hypothetical protein
MVGFDKMVDIIGSPIHQETGKFGVWHSGNLGRRLVR